MPDSRTCNTQTAAGARHVRYVIISLYQVSEFESQALTSVHLLHSELQITYKYVEPMSYSDFPDVWLWNSYQLVWRATSRVSTLRLLVESRDVKRRTDLNGTGTPTSTSTYHS